MVLPTFELSEISLGLILAQQIFLSNPAPRKWFFKCLLIFYNLRAQVRSTNIILTVCLALILGQVHFISSSCHTGFPSCPVERGSSKPTEHSRAVAGGAWSSACLQAAAAWSATWLLWALEEWEQHAVVRTGGPAPGCAHLLSTSEGPFSGLSLDESKPGFFYQDYLLRRVTWERWRWWRNTAGAHGAAWQSRLGSPPLPSV